MRFHTKYYFAALAALALTIPAYARTFKQTLVLNSNTTIGSTQLKPASYEVTGDDSKNEINFMQKGKVIATVPGKWTKILQKAVASSVVFTGDKITQVQFSGSDQEFAPQ